MNCNLFRSLSYRIAGRRKNTSLGCRQKFFCLPARDRGRLHSVSCSEKKNILSSFLRALSKGAYHIILGLGPVEASLGSNTKTCWSVIVISRPVLCQRIILAFMLYAIRDYARRVQCSGEVLVKIHMHCNCCTVWYGIL